MKIYRHRELADGSYRMAAHVDETKVKGDGSPATEWLLTFDFGPAPEGVSDEIYRAAQEQVVAELVQTPEKIALTHARASMQQRVTSQVSLAAGTPTALEGKVAEAPETTRGK